MAVIMVGIGEYYISNKPDDLIKTYALGSCVAVIVYDRVKKIAGLIHIALPDSRVSPEKTKKLPGYFADTGLPLLFTEMGHMGADRDNSYIKMAGGATVIDHYEKFDIGKRNILAVKKILWKNKLGVIAEDVEGDKPRTVSVSIDTGEIIITSNQKKWIL
jgi:chemotaxis protein CheD